MNKDKDAGGKRNGSDEPKLSLWQWLLILGTLLAAAIAVSFLK